MPIERLYLETSVWNFLLADDAPEKRAATEEFFELSSTKSWKFFISELVTDEIERTRDERRRAVLLETVLHWKPEVLPVGQEALELAKKYVLQGTFMQDELEDAHHAAVAVVSGCDVILSWNLGHLVKVKTRREINAANLLNGYRTIDIATPEQMSDMKGEEIPDELHQIREESMERSRGKSNEEFLRDLHARTAKTIEELGLKPAEPRWGASSSEPATPKAKS